MAAVTPAKAKKIAFTAVKWFFLILLSVFFLFPIYLDSYVIKFGKYDSALIYKGSVMVASSGKSQ